jgi:hypothetical protein
MRRVQNIVRRIDVTFFIKFVTEILEVIVAVQYVNCHHPVYCTKLDDQPVGVTCVSRCKDRELVLWMSVILFGSGSSSSLDVWS